MKITSGKWRGKNLYPPHGRHIRPTSGRSKEAMFNMLGARTPLADKITIDLFSGTGALGLEALSRGGACALFVDEDLTTTIKNIKTLNAEPFCQTARKNALEFDHALIPVADFVFMDPPYGQGLIEKTLKHLLPQLKTGAYILIEGEEPTLTPTTTVCHAQKKYGKAFVTLLEKTA